MRIYNNHKHQNTERAPQKIFQCSENYTSIFLFFFFTSGVICVVKKYSDDIKVCVCVERSKQIACPD